MQRLLYCEWIILLLIGVSKRSIIDELWTYSPCVLLLVAGDCARPRGTNKVLLFPLPHAQEIFAMVLPCLLHALWNGTLYLHQLPPRLFPVHVPEKVHY